MVKGIWSLAVIRKSNLHSVDLTERGITDIGRWSVLIGARAHKISYFQEKKILFKEKIKNFIKF